ncbi:MAG: DNA-binding protein [Clostridiales bacterium]|jgi:predicted DNA-binding protein YlxM (UPF0122 family)|nr:DNA-binding protein [Clostridiales bacterium]
MNYVKNLEIGGLNELYGALLTDKQREFIRLYYDCDLSLSEIGDINGVSRQAVRDAIVRGERELLRFESILGFDKKRRAVAEVCANAENPALTEQPFKEILSVLYGEE